ncbi:oxygen-insensitive NADPH nitroreductase, partial [Escherichia coli]|nr:oxygen-insensitive NADPH nitroreductase [Escherichia coli]
MALRGLHIGRPPNHSATVPHTQQLPHNLPPLCGLCLGPPADNHPPKPRLPASILVHAPRYPPLDQ